MYIDGFGIGGYRSFGSEVQKLGTFSKINFLVGQNNSGKSNILLFIREHYSRVLQALSKDLPLKLDNLDRHVQGRSRTTDFKFSICLPLNGTRFKQVSNASGKRREFLEKLMNSAMLTENSEIAWLELVSVNDNSPLTIPTEFVERVASSNCLTDYEWQLLWGTLLNSSGGNLKTDWIPATLKKIFTLALHPPNIKIIQAIRRIGDSGSSYSDDDYSGNGIINRLAQFQNPAHDQQDKRDAFNSINEFVQKVLGNPSAQLEIPFQRDIINVHMDGKTLPLSSLGTGIHEVVILAAAATVIDRQVLCIEEPELHLHPLLQKKLVRYLDSKTNNQYFFTTHSAHLLDSPDSSIFHVRLKDGCSTVDRAINNVDKSNICADLGYRGSDLLQTNCAIWVEGPSDRIYINQWIREINPKLIEGIHYSIMFYGGRLLSHLTADDPEVSDFISLRKINRYIAIIIDSDKKKWNARINATKLRIKREFDKGPGFAWVTQGREIENYISSDVLEKALLALHSDFKRLESVDQYGKAYHYRTSARRLMKENVDKIKLAHQIAEYPANLDVLDLRKKMNQLIQFIEESNDSEVSFLD